MDEDFEQNHYSTIAKNNYRVGHDCTKNTKTMADYHRYHEGKNYFGLMPCVLSALNEISQQ